jgi:hypothetical protein
LFVFIKLQRRPGTSSENRAVGNADERIEKNLQTIDEVTSEHNDQEKAMVKIQNSASIVSSK